MVQLSLPIITNYLLIFCVFATMQLASDRAIPYEAYFTQKLDHFEKKPQLEEKWQQRYFYYDKEFKKELGGPVFLLIGGEGPIDEELFFSKLFMDWAKSFGALLFNVEHRYYGMSQPFEHEWNIENLKYLTVAQALEDLANFIRTKKIELGLTENNKWIVIGGSYPGALAAWMRRKYPELVEGAIASSACFATKPFVPEYYESVSQTLDKYSPGCTENIKQAIHQLKTMIDKQKCKDVSNKFNINPLLDCTNKIQSAYLFHLIFAPFSVKVKSNKRTEFQDMCGKMNDLSIKKPIDRLAALIREEEGSINLHADINSYKKEKVNIFMTVRQWEYQRCTEFGAIQTTDSTMQPFGHYLDSNDAFNMFCIESFGPEYNTKKLEKGIKKIIKEFGGLDSKFSNTIFTVGDMDPWKNIQMVKHKKKNQVIEIYGASHCEDIEPKTNQDSNQEELAKVVEELKEFVDKLVDPFTMI